MAGLCVQKVPVGQSGGIAGALRPNEQRPEHRPGRVHLWIWLRKRSIEPGQIIGWIDALAVKVELDMHVRSRRHAGHADGADLLAWCHGLSGRDTNRVEMISTVLPQRSEPL